MATEPTTTEQDDTPQTETVFNQPQLVFGDHQWIQQGYEVIDECPNCPRYGVPIPQGSMLMKTEGKYELVDERTRLPWKK